MGAPDTSGKNGADAAEKRPVRGGIAGRKDYARDKLTNGSKTLPDTDGRLRIARRFRGIANAVLADQGGAGICLESRRQVIRGGSGACVLGGGREGGLGAGRGV